MVKRIIFTGDVMSYIPQNKVAFNGKKYDYSPVFSQIKELFDNKDIVVGNLETPIAGIEHGFTNEETVFNTPIEFVEAAKEAGFNVMTLANNHCLDRGFEGLKKTVENVRGLGLKTSGCYLSEEESQEPLVVELADGCKVSILSYTYGTNSEYRGFLMDKSNDYMVDLFRKQDPKIVLPPKYILKIRRFIKSLLPSFVVNQLTKAIITDCVQTELPTPEDEYYLSKMEGKIKKAKAASDIVIMCMHSGGQFNDEVGNYTKRLVKRLASLGCNVVVGNHTHDVLPFDFVDGCPVAYSLGNFCWTPKFGTYRKDALSEYSILLNLYVDTERKKLDRISVSFLKCVREKDGNSIVYPLTKLYAKHSPKDKRKIEKDFVRVSNRLRIKTKVEDIKKTEILIWQNS